MGKRFSILLTLLLVANLLIPPSMMSFAETEEESLPQLKFDFEDGTTQGWGARGGSVILTPTADAAYSGDYGLHVSGRVDAWNGTTIDVTDFMEVGKTYSLSAWARLPEGMPSSGVSVLIERHTDGTAHYEHVNGKTASDDTWVLISGEYTLKHPVERISVYFEAFDEPELEFYLDDIVIQEVPAPEPIVIEDDIPSLKDVFADHFKLGAAILSNEVEDPNGPDAQLLKKHYNSLTPGNELKWDATEPQEGVFNFTGSDKIVEFAEENGIAVRGHTLIWHSQTPNWVFYDDEGNLASKELLYERMKRHIETVMGRYKGKIYAWDVVNEVIEIGDRQPNGLRNSLWYQIAGEEFIEKAFEYAHAADPDAILYINDYNTHIPDRRDAMYDLVKRLKDKGIPVHGVGHQNHISITYPSLNEMDMMIEKFRDLGVRQEITELDMSIYSSDSQSYETFPYELQVEQALRYKDLFDIFKKHSDQLDAVIFWGKDDLNTWLRTFPVTRNNWPLLFDERMQAKLAYWALVDPTKLPAPIQELDANFGTPNIDGKKDLVWETVPAKSFNIADDIPVSFKTLWDDENLYVWTEVKDKTVNKNDLVEIFIHDENGILHNKINRKGKNQHHYKVKEGKDGYVAEIKISKEELAIGQEIRFDIRVTDVDGDQIASWNDPTNDQENKLENYGKLNLKAAINTANAVFGTPVLDGKKDKVWDKAYNIQTGKEIEGTNGAWANVRTLWDKEYLYIYAEVHDKTLTTASPNPWEQDSIEIFVDQNNGKTAEYESDDGQYRVNFNNEQSYGGAASSENFTTVTRLTDDGYVVEAAIKLNFAAKKGMVIGFDVQVNDDQNDDGSRDSVSIWEDATGQSYQNTSRIGVLEFTNKPNNKR